MRRLVISISILLVLASFSFGSAVADTVDDITGPGGAPKTDYVAELNKLGIAGRPESDNAAPYYQKAIGLYVEQPAELKKLDRQAWPADLSAREQSLLKKWAQSNAEALSQLELGAKKVYYWVEKSSPDRTMMHIQVPELAKFRQLCFAITWRAKLAAADGQIDKATADIVTCYRLGLHMGGPKTLVGQLVAIALRAVAIQTAFMTLDKTRIDKASLEALQSQIEQLSTSESYIPDMRFEKFALLDIIQRIFTDDGKGDGRINMESVNRILSQQGRIEPTMTSGFQKLSRRQTTETAEQVFEYCEFLVQKTPWQWKNERINPDNEIKKIAKENALVQVFCPGPPFVRIAEIFARCRADTDALIATLALLRFKADKPGLPEKLDELVSAGYLKALPTDPFSDGTFVYKRVGDDFTLYSFGEDCDDDGGNVVLNDKGKVRKWADAGDAVFWPVEPPQMTERRTDRRESIARAEQKMPTKSLHEAAMAGDVEQVQLLISSGADVNATDNTGYTPLFYAAQNSQQKVAELLIGAGANVNTKDQYGNTPLHYAAVSGHYDMCEVLVSNGADVAAKNLTGGTALAMAKTQGHSQIVELLGKQGAQAATITDTQDSVSRRQARPERPQRRAITDAISAGRPYTFDEQDESLRARPRPQQENQAESLNDAVVTGNIDQVQQLISKGADINAKEDRLGYTSLHTAVSNRRRAIAELLIAKGADINAKDRRARTPLFLAVESGQKDMVELLIAKGADVNATSGQGENALSLAQKRRHTEIVDLLLKHGATEPTLNLEDMYTRRGRAEGPNLYPDYEPQAQRQVRRPVPRQTMTTAQTTTEAKVDILADPNEIKARIMTFEGLEKALKDVDRRSQSEVREWFQRRIDNRIRLANAVERQVKAEISFIRKLAVEEAKKTTAAIDGVSVSRQKRLRQLIKTIKQESRGSRQVRGTRSRSRSRYPSTRQRYPQDMRTRGQTPRAEYRQPGRSTVGRPQADLDQLVDPNAGKTRVKGFPDLAKALEQVNNNSQNEVREWLQGNVDDRINLATVVHEQVRVEFEFIRKPSVEEVVKKTTAAIDGLLLNRQQRFEKLVKKLQEETRDLPGRYPGTGGTYPQDSRYRGSTTRQEEYPPRPRRR